MEPPPLEVGMETGVRACFKMTESRRHACNRNEVWGFEKVLKRNAQADSRTNTYKRLLHIYGYALIIHLCVYTAFISKTWQFTFQFVLYRLLVPGREFSLINHAAAMPA